MPVAPNHAYVIAKARALAPGGRVLDFGCGSGQALAGGLGQGLDIWGADVRARKRMPAAARERFRLIEEGTLPFPDAFFDAVASNQVFEHIRDLDGALREIDRVLKPGGVLVATYPTADTWFEPHAGVYFAHWLAAWPMLRRAWLTAAHAFGFGYKRAGRTRAGWVEHRARCLDEGCAYRPSDTIAALLRRHIGPSVEDLAADYMRFRLGRRAAFVPAPMLSAVCHLRAGQIVSVRKPDATAATHPLGRSGAGEVGAESSEVEQAA